MPPQRINRIKVARKNEKKLRLFWGEEPCGSWLCELTTREAVSSYTGWYLVSLCMHHKHGKSKIIHQRGHCFPRDVARLELAGKRGLPQGTWHTLHFSSSHLPFGISPGSAMMTFSRVPNCMSQLPLRLHKQCPCPGWPCQRQHACYPTWES